MLRYFNISMVLASLLASGTLGATSQPRPTPAPDATGTWTNEDLERLSRIPSLISIVGQPASKTLQSVETLAPLPKTKDPAWYASQVAALNARLEGEQADLRRFVQALEDVQELKTTTSGINLGAEDAGITPEATLDILQRRVRETQNRLDALEDLAQRNGIEPGILRGQSTQSQSAGTDCPACASKQAMEDSHD